MAKNSLRVQTMHPLTLLHPPPTRLAPLLQGIEVFL